MSQDGDKQEAPEGELEAVTGGSNLPPMNMRKRGPAHYWARLNAQSAAELQGAPAEDGVVAPAEPAAAAVATPAEAAQPLPIASLTPVAPPLSAVAEAPAVTLPVSEPPPAQVRCTPCVHKPYHRAQALLMTCQKREPLRLYPLSPRRYLSPGILDADASSQPAQVSCTSRAHRMHTCTKGASLGTGTVDHMSRARASELVLAV